MIFCTYLYPGRRSSTQCQLILLILFCSYYMSERLFLRKRVTIVHAISIQPSFLYTIFTKPSFLLETPLFTIFIKYFFLFFIARSLPARNFTFFEPQNSSIDVTCILTKLHPFVQDQKQYFISRVTKSFFVHPGLTGLCKKICFLLR